jgi:hypothetical protein
MDLINMKDTDSGAHPAMPIIRYAPFGELKIYPVLEAELNTLAKGGDESLYLNFATALLPTSLSLFVALLTTTINSNRVFVSFLTTAIVMLIAGLILLALWWRNRDSNQNLVRQIKDRMPPPLGIQIIENQTQVQAQPPASAR